MTYKNDERSLQQKYQDCFYKAQENYDLLKPLWEKLDKEQQAGCTPPAWKDPYYGTYGDILECAEKFERARQDKIREAERRAEREQTLQSIPKQEFRY